MGKIERVEKGIDHSAFSVSMCVYGKDNPDHFRIAVDSILNQTKPPNEIVLTVDGPVPDDLEEIIKNYELLTIFNVIRLPQNRGHGEARRTGMQKCKYDLVALMDADDISAFDRFEKQLAVFEAIPTVSVVGGNITEFVEESTNIVSVRNVPVNNAEIVQYIKKRCPINQVTVMFKKKDVEAVGGYKDWYCEEDYYLWLRLMLGGYSFANVPDVLVNVRTGKDMYQRRGGWKYFVSEAKLQKYMLDNRIIDILTYSVNVLKRLIVQLLLPNKIRGWVFQKFAREKYL